MVWEGRGWGGGLRGRGARLAGGGEVVGYASRDNAHIGLRPKLLPPHGLPDAHAVDVAARDLGLGTRVALDTPQPFELLVLSVVSGAPYVVLRREWRGTGQRAWWVQWRERTYERAARNGGHALPR